METTYEYQGKWRDNCVDGTNGKDGVGIKNDQIINGELIITLTDDITINAGKLEEEKEVTNTELEARQAVYLKMKIVIKYVK